MQGKRNVGIYVRAFRLPFILASILPFIFGSCIDKSSFLFMRFFIGLITVALTHLGANLINDYADSKYGADWQDRKWHTFFGGSKLIQEGVLPERFYLNAAKFCFAAACACILLLSFILHNLLIIGLYALILFLGFSYSHKPLVFSYRRLGELIIFILFGPAVVMGGYFIQTQIFPDPRSFILSLPFGFFTTAILYSNEVPDFQDDLKAGKLTWVNFLGQEKAFLLYCILIFSGFFCIGLNIIIGNLSLISALAFIFIFPALRAAYILRRFHDNKKALKGSSRITIALQALVSIILIADILL
ncbi:prenyltransferase [Candidatus Omnitrophota bacterium]